MSVYNLCPAPDLSTREQNYATWENGFSDSEIADIIEIGNSLTFYDGVIDKNIMDESIRKSSTSWIPCSNDAQFIYDKLGYITRMLNGQFFEFDLYGFVEDLQFTVYQAEGDHYEWHMDKGNLNSSPRKLSLVLQLSDPEEYEGGDLQFMFGKDIFTAERKKGLVYAFPSWVLHRVTPITAGTRKSLVCWLSGNKFR